MTPPNSPKWREFWIDNNLREIFLKKPHHTHSPNPIHVIEHDALISAQAELRFYKNEFESCAQARANFDMEIL